MPINDVFVVATAPDIDDFAIVVDAEELDGIRRTTSAKKARGNIELGKLSEISAYQTHSTTPMAQLPPQTP